MALSEKEKMLVGELYRSTDAELQADMAEAQQRLRQLNPCQTKTLSSGSRYTFTRTALRPTSNLLQFGGGPYI
jgi:maltose acetyltransferase-like protein